MSELGVKLPYIELILKMYKNISNLSRSHELQVEIENPVTLQDKHTVD